MSVSTALHEAALLEDDEIDDDYMRMPALHRAAFLGQLHVIRYLVVERGAKVSYLDNDGYTALHVACSMNQPEAVELLLKHGADMYRANDSGLLPIHVAAIGNSIAVVRLLIQHGFNVLETGGLRDTARDVAESYGHLELIRILEESELKLEKCVAFAMSHHARIGSESMPSALDPEVLRMIIQRV